MKNNRLNNIMIKLFKFILKNWKLFSFKKINYEK